VTESMSQPQAATTNIALLKAPVYTVVLSTILCYTLWHTPLRELEQQTTTYSHLGRLNWDCWKYFKKKKQTSPLKE